MRVSSYSPKQTPQNLEFSDTYLLLDEVRKIADKYGRWERVMKGGKCVPHKIISKRSWDKMLLELSERFYAER